MHDILYVQQVGRQTMFCRHASIKERKINRLKQLAQLLETEGQVLLATWRTLLKQLPSAKNLDTPTLNDHIPGLLLELITELRTNPSASVSSVLPGNTPPAHGLQRLEDGFEIEEVVTEYNILRGCIHDLALAHQIDLQGAPFHVVNRVLDMAIGSAVQTFATQQARKIQLRREEYLAFVAHDLRTPLNAIGLAARVIELALADEQRRTKPVQMIKTLNRNVHQLSALVDKILHENLNLETESGIKLERRHLDLWPLVEGLIHDLHPVAGTGSTQLINDVPDDLVVYADANLLRRVFQNLIANAINYTPRGKVIINARENIEADEVECCVIDNGEGIAKDQLSKIFTKYESDPDQSRGYGLGLAISKTFIDAHGGIVGVESVIGVGSTFRFTLPGEKIAGQPG
ncbi:MAG: HAMP domain-containing sensor histidine kinase [Pseudomonadota bacterium]